MFALNNFYFYITKERFMADTNIYLETLSPCKNICQLDVDRKYCIGCYRTVEEKRNWSKFTNEEKLKILDELKYEEKRFYK